MKIPKFSLKGTDEKVYSSEDLRGEYIISISSASHL